jgi:hypothetical protein
MINLNDDNGAGPITRIYAQKVLDNFMNPTLVELGSPYGGGVERIGIMSNRKGKIFAFDTYEGHPKELSYSQGSHEATCMDPQYQKYGREALEYDYQRAELDKQGLSNVILRKGLINDNSMKDAGITEIHYALLDLDMITPMVLAWRLVRPLMQPGGFLCLHDVVPREHICGLWGLYQEILASGEYNLILEEPKSYIVVLERNNSPKFTGYKYE